MNRTIAVAVVGLAGISAAIFAAGCRETPPPPQTPVPSADGSTVLRTADPPRPIDIPDYEGAPPGTYSDIPLVIENVPETRDFLAAYNRVGRPRLTLFVNRTLEGNLLPVERRDGSGTGGGTGGNDPFADQNKDRTEAALRSGLYDDAAAKSIYYEAIENVLTDWLMAGGQTTMISPTLVRQKLTEQQIRDLTSGKLIVNAEIAEQLGADVLVQVQARPTRQTPQGVEVRIVAEAMNIKGGQALGHAVVDVPPPLEKPAITRSTRFLARKLMNGMTGTWKAMPEARPEARPAVTPPPPTTPGDGRGENSPRNPLDRPPTGGIDQGPDMPTNVTPQPPGGNAGTDRDVVAPAAVPPKPPGDPVDPVPPPTKPAPPGPVPPPNPVPPGPPSPPPIPPVPPGPPTQPAPPPPAPMPPGTQPAPLPAQ